MSAGSSTRRPTSAIVMKRANTGQVAGVLDGDKREHDRCQDVQSVQVRPRAHALPQTRASPSPSFLPTRKSAVSIDSRGAAEEKQAAMHPGALSGPARTLSDPDLMRPPDEPPVLRVDSTDGSTTYISACPPSFAAQVRWLCIVFGNTWPSTSGEQLVAACLNLRRLNIMAAAMDFSLLTGPAGARALAGIQTFRFQSVILDEDSPVDFVLAAIDRLVAHMPALRDLTLVHSPRREPASAQADPPAAFPHMSNLALQRYEIPALFTHAGLPFLGSQDTLRELRITLADRDSPAARESLLHARERVSMHRLRHLVLVNRATHLPSDFAPRLLAACPTVRALELITIRIAPDAYDWLNSALLAPGLRVSTLVVSTNVRFADDSVLIMLRHVQRMRMLRTLFLRCAADSGDADLERLRHACRLQRVTFTFESNG